MDIDEFLKQELNIKGRIENLIHHLTYGELKRIIIKYAGLQRDCNEGIQPPGRDKPDSEDPA